MLRWTGWTGWRCCYNGSCLLHDPERQATIRAGEIAATERQRLLTNQPQAALSYGVPPHRRHIDSLSLWSRWRHFDVTNHGKFKRTGMKILATLATIDSVGKDWDDKIIIHAAEGFECEHGENPLTWPIAYLGYPEHRAVDQTFSYQPLTEPLSLPNLFRKFPPYRIIAGIEEMTQQTCRRCRSLVDWFYMKLRLRQVKLIKSFLSAVTRLADDFKIC